MPLPDFLTQLSPETGLAGIFLFTLVYSFTLPISEEIALILVGLVASTLELPFGAVLFLSYAGMVLSDFGYYGLARHFGCRLLSSRLFRRLVNPRKILASELYFRRRGPRIAFFCRFLVGLRAPAMIASGILKMPFRNFALYDSLAAVFSALLWLVLGYFYGRMAEGGIPVLARILAIVAPLFVLGGILLMYRKILKEQNRLLAELPAPDADGSLAGACAEEKTG